jgi:peptidoglycan/LPS O-acetylase OafA/YrhL
MRIEQITFTRFIAAILIVIFHFGKNIYPFNNSSVSFIFQNTYIGVSYFFILSGFIMIIAYNNKTKINAIEYFKNRFARIYPIYLLALLLVVSFKIIAHSQVNFNEFILNLFTLQAWFPGNVLSLNGPGWSLSVEFFFYAIFPMLFNFIYTKIDYTKLIIPIILIWIISQILLHLLFYSDFYEGYPSQSHDILHYFPLLHLNEFLIGNLTGLIFINYKKKSSKNFDWVILSLIIASLFLLKYSKGLNLNDGILAFIFAPLIFLISLNTGVITSISKNKYLIFLGDISYGIYILQIPTFALCGKILSRLSIQNASAQFYSSLLFLIIASGFSYVFIETPLRNLIKKYI